MRDEELNAIAEKVVKALKTIDENPLIVMLGVLVVIQGHIELLQDKGEYEVARGFVEGLRMIVNEHDVRIQ